MTPTPRKNKYDLRSFDPRYKDALLRGAREEFRLTFPSTQACYRFQRRVNLFRKVHKEEYPDSEITKLLYRCKVVREKNSTHLTFSPHDDEFSEVFRSAGFGASESEIPTTPAGSDSPLLSHDPLDDL